MDRSQAEDRWAELQRRVQLLEDQVAILRLINTWGPAVDSGHARAAAGIWSEDGVLESDMAFLEGPSAVAAMVKSDGQQALIRQGCAHVPSFPLVTVDGDRATASGYTCVYRRSPEGGHEVWRVSANRWEFRRTSHGWRMTRRVNQVIDGGPTARTLLSQALSG